MDFANIDSKVVGRRIYKQISAYNVKKETNYMISGVFRQEA